MSPAVEQTTFGKYRMLEELGSGAFATVYRALDTVLEREVAIKVLDPLLMRDHKWAAGFQREAKTIARLKHPHIVTIYEIGETEGRLYIAMELLEGGSLAQRIAGSGRVPWDETLTVVTQVAEALDYAHAQNIVHRDLKPSNILLDPYKGAVLTDFGFAKLVGDSSFSVSMSGGIVGTPAYIALEIWEGEVATPRTDVYALACVLYEMLTGQMLFGGNTPMAIMKAHDRGAHLPTEWPVDVPNGIGEVMAKALARDPRARYDSAGAFLRAVMAFAGSRGQQKTAAPPESVTALERAERPRQAPDDTGRWPEERTRVSRLPAESEADVSPRPPQARSRFVPAGATVTCPHCDESFYTDEAGWVECPECERGFTLNQDFSLQGSVVTCPHCDESFYTEEAGWVECPECERGFTLNQDFSLQGSVVTCPHCDESFYTEEAGWVECPECEGGFTLNQDFSLRGSVVTCPHCDESFYTDEAGWVECPYCEEGFTVKSLD